MSYSSDCFPTSGPLWLRIYHAP